jgi:hypothetical protein
LAESPAKPEIERSWPTSEFEPSKMPKFKGVNEEHFASKASDKWTMPFVSSGDLQTPYDQKKPKEPGRNHAARWPLLAADVARRQMQVSGNSIRALR